MVTMVTPSTESILSIHGVRSTSTSGIESLDWTVTREKFRDDVSMGSLKVRIS